MKKLTTAVLTSILTLAMIMPIPAMAAGAFKPITLSRTYTEIAAGSSLQLTADANSETDKVTNKGNRMKQ